MVRGSFGDMKALNLCITLVCLAVTAGCQSHKPQMVSDAPGATPQVAHTWLPQSETDPSAQSELKPTIIEQFSTDDATYTIESIPNPTLTPTSREGDKMAPVYSTNIIGIFVHPKNGAVRTNDRMGAAAPANTAAPPGK